MCVCVTQRVSQARQAGRHTRTKYAKHADLAQDALLLAAPTHLVECPEALLLVHLSHHS